MRKRVRAVPVVEKIWRFESKKCGNYPWFVQFN
jgi:hypothetical protein